MAGLRTKTVALIVAHPDDETLWAGGTILSNPAWRCFVVCLCRGSDKERASRFYQALTMLHAAGAMGDLDDGPEQTPLNEYIVQQVILDLLPSKPFDLIISHDPGGEYTRHRRHEETGKAVIQLWHNGKIGTNELWTFAYEDNNRQHYPKPVEKATFYHILKKRIWRIKYRLITNTYGFMKSSWEAQTTPRSEAFWQFSNSADAIKWLDKYTAETLCRLTESKKKSIQ